MKARDRLTVPVAVALTLMWVAAGLTALITAKTEVFIVATAPFGTLCGYLFARDIFRRTGAGIDDSGGSSK